MPICPHCSFPLADAPDLAGQFVACPHCGHQFPLAPPTAPPDSFDSPQQQFAVGWSPVVSSQPLRKEVRQTRLTNSFAIASLVVAVLSVGLCWMPFVGPVIAGLATLLGLVAMPIGLSRKGVGIGFAIAGLGLSAVSLAIGIPISYGVIVVAKELRKQIADPEAARDVAPAVAMKQAVRTGGFLVRVKSCRIDTAVAIGSSAYDSKASNGMFVVEIEVTNESRTKKRDYVGSAQSCIAHDNLGNSYESYRPGSRYDVFGQVNGVAAVYPGESWKDLLIFEPPVDAADYVEILIPAKSFDTDEPVKFRIPKSALPKRETSDETREHWPG